MSEISQQASDALSTFAESITQKFQVAAKGAPEDQLRAPFETFLMRIGGTHGHVVVAKGESTLEGRLGRPDYAVTVGGALAGYVELKEPGKSADPRRFKGHDRRQWERFRSLPNLLYTDGNEWSLFQDGQRVNAIVRLDGDVTEDGKGAASVANANEVSNLLLRFFAWQPIVPKSARGLAQVLAPVCRLLRGDVTDSVANEKSALSGVADDWRNLLFPDADDERFSDAFAQTVTFALLLAKANGGDVSNLQSAAPALEDSSTLLAQALRVFVTAPGVEDEIGPSLRLLQRIIQEIQPDTFTSGGEQDPWLYFYEDFLAAYDANLRKDAGAYYTPVEVVSAQVNLVHDLLVHRLDRKFGFADESVVTLDPAVGTGTYLLGAIKRALDYVETDLNRGAGARAGRATTLAKNLFGFEIMTGPYAVAELRVTEALRREGGSLPNDGVGVLLTDTLESPHAVPPQPMYFAKTLAEQHRRALEVKETRPVLVCIGNPPYDRHAAAIATDAESRARTGGWVRWGDEGNIERSRPILDDFKVPAAMAGHSGDLKNIYNLYTYFWRWTLWKVFEHTTTTGPGVVSLITASSYIDGDAFSGMREHMRRQCDEIWVVDLGGEGRGTRQEDNVFAIQTPVAIAVAVRYGDTASAEPAVVRYHRVSGTRDEKLAILSNIDGFGSLKWQKCRDQWQAPFTPEGRGSYFEWPNLVDLMPWQHSGVKIGRAWSRGPSSEALHKRWQTLLTSPRAERRSLFKESPSGRKATDTPASLQPPYDRLPALLTDDPDKAEYQTIRYGFRSFDRQHLIPDSRVIDRPGPPLWQVQSKSQVYFNTLLNHPLGKGPAMTITAHIPDLHHFRGSYGAKDVFPLYRTDDSTDPNIVDGLLEQLAAQYGVPISAEQLAAYIYCVLAHPIFTDRFFDELTTRELRVPLTKDATLFKEASEFGHHLIWLHTFGDRCHNGERPHGKVPAGSTTCTTAVPQGLDKYPERYSYDSGSKRLLVGEGVFEPVSQDVWEYEVSGLKVVQSWLGYRMRNPHGRKSSPLDEIGLESWPVEFTDELLELLWVLEHTIAGYPEQAAILDRILASELFTSEDLPEPSASERKAPEFSLTRRLL